MKKIFTVLMIALVMICACNPSTPEVIPEEPIVEVTDSTSAEVTDSTSVEVTDSTSVETPEKPEFDATTEDMIPEQGNM